MPRKRRTTQQKEVQDYRHDTATRKNNPPAGIAAQGHIQETPKQEYAYNPHLPPNLRSDPNGDADKLPELLQIAQQRALSAEEAKTLADALRHHGPWLEWAGKRETKSFSVDPVALHIHERVSAKAILKVAERQNVQRELFADPQQDYSKAVDFYQHDVDWANRLILGDSLTVMSSLTHREDLAGKVQMIYIDPPYGIKFASNFQPTVFQRDVKDREQDLTREREQIKAYRDTWTLGVHSYLAYLRDRLRDLAKGRMRKVFLKRQDNSLASHFEDSDGQILTVREHSLKQQSGESIDDYKPFMSDNLIRRSNPEIKFDWQGRKIEGRFRTNERGLKRALQADRILFTRSGIRYKFFLDDFPVSPLNHLWDDVIGAQNPIYAVQTNTQVIERCMLMTTDPGDLVLDPTCVRKGTQVLTVPGMQPPLTPIEDLHPGDWVLSHTGKPRRVLRTIHKRYCGQLIGIQHNQSSTTLWMTADHYILCKQRTINENVR